MNPKDTTYLLSTLTTVQGKDLIPALSSNNKCKHQIKL